jgi:DNA-binding PadR family transcriptional regulator
MALAHALLASLLVDGPCSGYDMVKRFDEKISCYWMSSHQQVYKALRELESQGWVSSETITQTSRPNKNIYSITSVGKEHLAHWVLTPSEPTTIREDLMIKTTVGFLVPRPAIINELKRRYQIHQENFNILKAIEQEEFSDLNTLSVEAKFDYLTLRRGIRFESDWMAWCEEAITMIGEDLDTPSP